MATYTAGCLKNFKLGFVLDGYAPVTGLQGPYRGPDNQVYYYEPQRDQLIDPESLQETHLHAA